MFTFQHLIGALILGLAGSIIANKIFKDRKKSLLIGALVCIIAAVIRYATL